MLYKYIDDSVPWPIRDAVVKMVYGEWSTFHDHMATKGIDCFMNEPRYIKRWEEMSMCISKLLMKKA